MNNNVELSPTIIKILNNYYYFIGCKEHYSFKYKILPATTLIHVLNFHALHSQNLLFLSVMQQHNAIACYTNNIKKIYTTQNTIFFLFKTKSDAENCINKLNSISTALKLLDYPPNFSSDDVIDFLDNIKNNLKKENPTNFIFNFNNFYDIERLINENFYSRKLLYLNPSTFEHNIYINYGRYDMF